MQQRIVTWGEIGTDKKALITIQLDEAESKILITAFPKEMVSKELQNEIFVEWKNGGNNTFPETTYQWTIDANQDNILPENVKVERPEIVTQAQLKWSRKLMSAKLMLLLTNETELILQKLDTVQQYDQNLWNTAKNQWDKIAEYQKKGEITWEQTTQLKEKINHVFDALKAFKRLTNELDTQQSNQLIKKMEQQIDDLQAMLIYPDKWKQITTDLKKTQEEIKNTALNWNIKRKLFANIDSIYADLKKYRTNENINKSKTRITELKKILTSLEESIQREKNNYNMQIEKMQHYTKGKMPLQEIESKLSYITNRIKQKESKIADIKKTMQEVEKIIAKEEYKIDQNKTQNEENQTITTSNS